uniref:RING-type domain-containing protein n=1 Tax=Lymantria dispar multicapsid nuclear polyhedrosis virus TaxID=10449 RepID=A0A1B1MR72_NPVLD|nr:hypothetical protein [Lymantria dispar multiple nucleopolyhedrovirus]
MECLICFERTTDGRFLMEFPCHHQVCNHCWRRLSHCPLCRRRRLVVVDDDDAAQESPLCRRRQRRRLVVGPEPRVTAVSASRPPNAFGAAVVNRMVFFMFNLFLNK